MTAKWLLQLITGGSNNHIFPLPRQVSNQPPVVATATDVVIQVDTNPWGAGATLDIQGQAPRVLDL